MDDVYEMNGNVMEKMIVLMAVMKWDQMVSLVLFKRNAHQIQFVVIIQRNAYLSSMLVMVITIAVIILMKMLSIVKMVKFPFVQHGSFNVIIIDAFRNNGNVIRIMIVVMVLMKNWKCVQIRHALRISLHAVMVVVFRFTGFVMVIMIVMIIRMKIKKGVHQFNVAPSNFVAPTDGNVSHSKITVMVNRTVMTDLMKKVVSLRIINVHIMNSHVHLMDYAYQ